MTIHNRQEAMAWQRQYNARAPCEGDPAPDFRLWDVHGQNPVQLSDFKGTRPVALVFGSYT
jgi:peroxiredoxin